MFVSHKSLDVQLLLSNIFKISGNSEQNIILQIFEQLIQFCYLLSQNAIFLVSSFLEQFTGEGEFSGQYLINAATCLFVYLSELVEILSPGQVALTAIFYLGQVLHFFRSIKKNVLEVFLLRMYKEHTLSRSTSFVGRNHPNDVFD